MRPFSTSSSTIPPQAHSGVPRVHLSTAPKSMLCSRAQQEEGAQSKYVFQQ